MTVPQCQVAGREVTERDEVSPGGRSRSSDGRGGHRRDLLKGARHLSGGSPVRPASPPPSPGCSPEAEPPRAEEGGRAGPPQPAPARASPRPPYPARHGAQSQHAPHRLRVAGPAGADKMETASLLLFGAYLLSGRHFRCRRQPPLGLRHFLSD